VVVVSGAAEQLRGSRILVLNWRDVRHPQAGGAEQYMHEIAARWVQAGVGVTWYTARGAGQRSRDRIDGIHVLRAGDEMSVYAWTAVRLLRTRGHFDAVVDCQNGVPFFAPMFVGRQTPVVQVVHHVHQDQFATRFPRPMATLGRVLEGPVARHVYRDRPIAAVSPSTRTELRRQLGFPGPIHIVPNGAPPVPETRTDRAGTPTIVVVSRLVPHKRVDLLLGHLSTVAARVANLRVEIVGDGPERPRLQALAADLGLQATVRFHGRVSAEVRDDLLSRAWLTTSTSAAEGWGCTVIEAASRGVPCLALRVPGIRDSVLHGETGWLVDRSRDFGAALVDAVDRLRNPSRAAAMERACREWSRCFSWDRSADLLAGVVLEEVRALAAREGDWTGNRRLGRSDMAVLLTCTTPPGTRLSDALRATDEVVCHGGRTSVLLTGCDEVDALAVSHRLRLEDVEIRLVDRRLLLAGPASVLRSGDGDVGHGTDGPTMDRTA
jgi:glycosyltransferase involved in cell wall biosynthesis